MTAAGAAYKAPRAAHGGVAAAPAAVRARAVHALAITALAVGDGVDKHRNARGGDGPSESSDAEGLVQVANLPGFVELRELSQKRYIINTNISM